MKRKTYYQITDLNLEAPRNLTPLADALVHRGLLTYHVHQRPDGWWSARLAPGEGFEDPNPNMAAMLTAIEALEEPARSLWAACTLREFDIGYQCGDEPREFNQQLTSDTLARITAAGATIRITLYPVIETDYSQAAVEILKKDKSIQRQIGSRYPGYHYHSEDLPSLKEALAEVKVTLIGKKGSLYVHCLMELNKQEEWTLKAILKKGERQNLSSCCTTQLE
jgi:hypothetical protein